MSALIRAPPGGVLRHKNMLPDASFRKPADFVQNRGFIPAAVGPADHGDGAEGAAVGTPFPDPYIGGVGGSRQHPVLFKVGIVVLTDVNAPAFERLSDLIRQRTVLIDAEQQVDLRNLLQQVLFVTLGQTAGHDQQPAASGVFVLRHFKNRVDRFLLGGTDKSAGVDQQNIRFSGIGRKPVSSVPQKAQSGFRVNPVFIASQRNGADGKSHGRDPPSSAEQV